MFLFHLGLIITHATGKILHVMQSAFYVAFLAAPKISDAKNRAAIVFR